MLAGSVIARVFSSEFGTDEQVASIDGIGINAAKQGGRGLAVALDGSHRRNLSPGSQLLLARHQCPHMAEVVEKPI